MELERLEQIKEIYDFILYKMENPQDNPYKVEDISKIDKKSTSLCYRLICFYGNDTYMKSFDASKTDLFCPEAKVALAWRNEALKIIKDLFIANKDSLILKNQFLNKIKQKTIAISVAFSLFEKVEFTKNKILFVLLHEIYMQDSFKQTIEEKARIVFDIYIQKLYETGNLPFTYLQQLDLKELDRYISLNQYNKNFSDKQKVILEEIYETKLKQLNKI